MHDSRTHERCPPGTGAAARARVRHGRSALTPLVAAALLQAAPAHPQEPAGGAPAHHDAPVAHAVRTAEPMRIDGVLDEAAWSRAMPITSFTQRDPEEGAPASQPTEVRILYDDAALYVGARLRDAGPVTTRLGRRDMPRLDADWFSVTLDSYHDHRTAFRFEVNPGGVQRDATITATAQGESEDPSWDPVWDVATRVDEDGWTVEMRIPFSQLRFRRDDEPVWGIQIARVIGRRGEVAHFSFVPKSDPGGVPAYGHLHGLASIEPRERLEVLPYLVGRGEYVDPGPNPFRAGSEYAMNVGADVLYRLTPDLTLNATFNPDFGQVEVDPAVVELGVYETFFPERRPFFVEGGEIFRFTGNTSGGQLFYSRRIGRAPQLHPGVAAADVPDATRILGAGKLSGRVGGWSVGVLNAVTAAEEARTFADGTERRVVAEPAANALVGRARRDMAGGRSAVGAALTSVVRRLGEPEARAALHASAWAGGVDFRHEWADRTWQVDGGVIASHVRGSPEAIARTQRMPHHYFQRPDAEHLGVDAEARALTGYSAGIGLTKQAGAHWRGSIAAAATSPRFEVNDLGFGTRTDRRDLQGSITYRENRPGRVLRDWSVTAMARREENFDGDPILRYAQLTGFARHLDFWGVDLAVQRLERVVDDRSTRGGPLLVRPAETAAAVNVFSDPRRPVSLTANARAGRGEFDARQHGTGASIDVRASPWWNVSVAAFLARGRIPAQYLATVPDPDASATYGARYLFAPLDYTQAQATVRLNVTFAPRLTLEMFAQPMIFALDFDEVGALAAPRTFDFEPYAGELPPFDHTVRSLRGTAVLRWEWRPGSTIYMAWQQSRHGFGEDGTFGFANDVRGLFSAPSDNILVLKATYWLNP